MKVSICIVAYNAENFINQALDSVLMQKVNFDYEILINDDASSDGTVEIVEKYQNKYPNIIKLFTHQTNQYQQGNYKLYEDNLFVNAKGNYIAMLDADDFWTDTHKLQTTVDFLDKNKDYSMILHGVDFYLEQTGNYAPIPKKPTNTTLSNADLIGIGSYCFPPCSMVFRNVVKQYPDFMNCLTLDKSVVYLLMTYGKIGYLDKIMAAYRQHNASFISKTNAANKLKLLKSNITLLNNFNTYSNYKYTREIKNELSKTAKIITYFGTKEERKDVLKYINFIDLLKVTFFKLFRV